MTQQQALEVLKTGGSVFLTGEPGSGKTYVINEYIRYLKNAGVGVAVTASTGIAATHIGGMTIHSWSGIGIKRNLSKYAIDRIATTERIAKRIRKTAVLILDEVSMIDGETLETVSRVCQEVKQDEKPFGGLQVVVVGDFFQLPPVTKETDSPQFAFNSPLWEQLNPLVCYLTEQHRQQDPRLHSILAALRQSELTPEHRAQLDARYTTAEQRSPQLTQLFAHNLDVDRINAVELEKIEGKKMTFRMTGHGRETLVEQLKRGCLSPEELTLKSGAVVMFTKNDPKKTFVNGTLGTVIDFDKSTKCPVVQKKDGRKIIAKPMDWAIEDNNRVLAAVSQIPLRLAWALTVHKSQGMSLDAAFIDLHQAFVAGQGYVALSRVRSLDGLFLAGYNDTALVVHEAVSRQDELFRQQSQTVGELFAKLSPADLQNMHTNFLRASGGSLSPSAKTYSVMSIRAKHPKAYTPWRDQEIQQLKEYHQAGKGVQEISKLLGRQPGAIRARLEKINLIQ